MQLTEQQIQLIKAYFTDKPVKRAYLFGSYATNEATESSDVDLLVELDYSKRIGLAFVKMQSDLGNLLSKKVDLVSAKAVSELILPFIDKQKQLVYEEK
ncbi:MAG: putative nucleotidyltransferase [Spirosomataceae bacterium]|jgi:predicted nucleotidyltransferase